MIRRQIPPAASEHQIQKSIVDYLERVLPSTVRVVAVSNKPRSAMQGALEKARGAKKGFPDLFLTGAFHGLLEVKTEGGVLAREQKEWRDWAGEMQLPYAVVRSVDDVRETLDGWGVRTRAA
jgi:hypothetical protein